MVRFIAEPVWSWPLVALAAVALIAVVLLTYPPRIRHLPPLRRRLLLGMRLASAVLLIWALLRPAVQYLEIDSQAAVLVVLMDKSRSMTTPDGPGGITRREELLKVLAESDEQLEELAEDIEIRYVDFDSTLFPTDEPGAEADGQFTALGKVLDETRREDAGKRLVGIVLISDGAQRAVGEDDVDPRAAARRIAEERGVQIHTVLVGTSELATAGLDLSVEDVLVAPDTFEKKTTPVQAQVRLIGASGRKVKVRLLLEDRTGKSAGESGELVEIPYSADAKPMAEIETRENSIVIPVDLSFVAQQAGEYKLAIEVVPLDGELKVNNNRVETLITVRKGGLKVAYFDILRPEAGKLLRLNQTSQIQLDWQVVLAGERQSATQIDPALFAPGAYDVYIIGDVPASVFRLGGTDLLLRLAERVEQGAGLAMIGGRRNFGSGGYGGTRLREYLPVLMASTETLTGDQVDPSRHHSRKLQMIPTRDGLRHYLMQIAPRDNERMWRNLPPLAGATRLEEKSENVEVLAESDDGVPLLFAADTGRARVVAFAADDTYRWHLHGFEDVHQRFWQQLILWLAHKEHDADAPVWVRVEPKNFAPGARVPIVFGARDAEKQPIEDAEFKVEVLTPAGERKELTVVRGGAEALAEFSGTEEPGDYWVTVTALQDGAALSLPAMARFIVDARDLELDNPAADPDLMEEIASVTGAVPLPPEQFGTFLDELLDEGISTEITRQTQVNLWDNWWLLGAFVLLLACEWFLRKRRGLV